MKKYLISSIVAAAVLCSCAQPKQQTGYRIAGEIAGVAGKVYLTVFEGKLPRVIDSADVKKRGVRIFGRLRGADFCRRRNSGRSVGAVFPRKQPDDPDRRRGRPAAGYPGDGFSDGRSLPAVPRAGRFRREIAGQRFGEAVQYADRLRSGETKG